VKSRRCRAHVSSKTLEIRYATEAEQPAEAALDNCFKGTGVPGWERDYLRGRGYDASYRIRRDANGVARDLVLDDVNLGIGDRRLNIRRDPFGDMRVTERPMIPRRRAMVPTPAHRAPFGGIDRVRFQMLAGVRRALATTLARNWQLHDPGHWLARRDAAENLAQAVLQALNLHLPPIQWLPNSDDAYALGGRIYMGENLARQLSLPALAQILLHEAGHVHEGHADPSVNFFLAALRDNGYLSEAQYNRMMRDDERVADVYAAIGAWMFDPGERPAMGDWLVSHGHGMTATHPSGAERARNMQMIVAALDAALVAGALDQGMHVFGDPEAHEDPWAFGDGVDDGGDPFGFGGDGGE
jgi:hypothetical protein